MTQKDFDKLLQDCFTTIESILCSKSKEYSTNEDKLVNFKTAAALNNNFEDTTALWGMAVKHTVKLASYIQRLEKGDITITDAAWKEVIFDDINYRILLLALLKERGLV